jgi:RNA polymerase sigma-70 factor, ECF subfamily
MPVEVMSDAELSAWLAAHREQLRRLIALRLDERLSGRIDASDIVQETLLEAVRRYDAYRRQPTMPRYMWLRWIPAGRPAWAGRSGRGRSA